MDTKFMTDRRQLRIDNASEAAELHPIDDEDGQFPMADIPYEEWGDQEKADNFAEALCRRWNAAPLLYKACKEIFNWPGLLRWGNECRFCQVKDDLQFPEKHDPKCPGRILAAAIAAAEKGE